jgi:hypothetical protein
MKADKTEKKDEGRSCPYCEETLPGALSEYCHACKVKTFVCPVCHTPMPRDKKECPVCKTKIKDK